MNRLIHVGFGNIVNTDKIIAIVSPESAPIKRLVQKAKETGLAIDATQGRRTKSVLVMENSQIVLSALLPETIAGRAQALWPEDEKRTVKKMQNKGILMVISGFSGAGKGTLVKSCYRNMTIMHCLSP